MHIVERNALGSNLNCLDLIDTFVEVGVLRGDYSSTVLSQWKGSKAYLIDSWKELPNAVDVVSKLNQSQHNDNYEYVKYRFKDDSRVSVVRKSSEDSAKLFEDTSLDCVYLDADHSYIGVEKDLELWWSKIKDGGMLCGHDYQDCFWGDPQNDPGSTWTSVHTAVKHFFSRQTNCSCIISSWLDSNPSWHVFKIEEKIDPKDILVLSCATNNLTYSYKTELNHKRYCDYHGYSYEMVRENFWSDAHPAWSKLKFTQERLSSYRWIMWLDADAVFLDFNTQLNKFLIPRMGHVSSTWNAYNRLQLTNGISFWQNIPWTFDLLKNSIKHKNQFAFSGVWEEEGIRRALDVDILNYGRWLGVEIPHFNSWPHYNTWNNNRDFIHHWGGVKYRKEQLINDSLRISEFLNDPKKPSNQLKNPS